LGIISNLLAKDVTAAKINSVAQVLLRSLDEKFCRGGGIFLFT
jgi:hypothetical protein